MGMEAKWTEVVSAVCFISFTLVLAKPGVVPFNCSVRVVSIQSFLSRQPDFVSQGISEIL